MQAIIKSVRTAILTSVVLLTAAAGQAATVEYYTEGSFGNLGLAVGPMAYIPVGSALLPASATFENFTFASLGAIQNLTGDPVEVGGTLTINIFQVSPTEGTDSLIGSFSGVLGFSASTAVFTPNEGSITIGKFTYSFAEPFSALVPITAFGGITSLQGQISDPSGVPEPASVALLGGGLALVGFLGRRFRRSA